MTDTVPYPDLKVGDPVTVILRHAGKTRSGTFMGWSPGVDGPEGMIATLGGAEPSWSLLPSMFRPLSAVERLGHLA